MFDVLVKNPADVIVSNKKLTKYERLSDVSFLEDQRGKRKAVMGAKDKKYTKAIKRQQKELESAIRRNIPFKHTTVNPETLSDGDDVEDSDDGKDMDYHVDGISKSHKWKPDFIPVILPRRILKETVVTAKG